MIRFLSRAAVDLMHKEQLAEHGGLNGIKDENALEAALARPLNKASYETPTVYELAAAYLYGIVRNHPYSDGNKRTGFLAAFTFLYINGFVVEASQAIIIEFVLGVAAGEISEENAARFFADHCQPLSL